MPLTFAHPAAVLPLRWMGLPFATLVIGSMTPDGLYFPRLAPSVFSAVVADGAHAWLATFAGRFVVSATSFFFVAAVLYSLWVRRAASWR